MRRVARAAPPNPEEFDRLVGQPGQRALLELIGSDEAPKRRGPKRAKVADRVEDIPVDKLPPDWRAAIPMLQQAYAHTCAYLGLRIDPAMGHPTVDHFVPQVVDRRLAYDWDNFRLATGQMNTNKGAHRDVLDPFVIQDGWFQLDFGTYFVVPGNTGSPPKTSIEATIRRLKLNDPVFVDKRRDCVDRYLGNPTDDEADPTPWPLTWLEREAPFVAAELRRQQRLRPEDR